MRGWGGLARLSDGLDGEQERLREGYSAGFPFEMYAQSIQIRVFESVCAGGGHLHCCDVVGCFSFEQELVKKVYFHIEHPLG